MIGATGSLIGAVGCLAAALGCLAGAVGCVVGGALALLATPAIAVKDLTHHTVRVLSQTGTAAAS